MLLNEMFWTPENTNEAKLAFQKRNGKIQKAKCEEKRSGVLIKHIGDDDVEV